MSRVFLDTNVLVYALGEGTRAGKARDLLDGGGRISVQCLNEMANVALNKMKLTWPELEELLADVRAKLGPVLPVDEQSHADGIRLARQYRLSIYDGMIVAAALAAGCDVLYPEDMHAGLVIDGRLRVVNPFA